MKICIKCMQEYPAENFAKHSTSGKPRRVCKTCRAKQSSAWKKTPKGKASVKAHAKRVYDKDPDAARARSRAWNHANSDSRINTHLKRTFGITLVNFIAMRKAQKDCCAVCKKPETVVDRRSGKPRRLHVDHNHKTGEVRGLLCTRCNMAVGYVADDPKRAIAVADYLTKHMKKENLVAA